MGECGMLYIERFEYSRRIGKNQSIYHHLDLSEATLIKNRIKRRENRLPSDLVIGSKVVDLLLEYTGPEVFTYKLHNVQLILKPCCVFSQSRGKQRDG